MNLTKTEGAILTLLSDNRGKTVSVYQIGRAIWPRTPFANNTVCVHVKNLRRKLRKDMTIETVRGAGYRLVA